MTQFLPKRDEINPVWISKWGESFGSADLAHQLANNDRIFDRIRDRMLEAFGIDTNAEIKQEDAWAATAYGTDRDRLSRICGMVIHGDHLKTCITKEAFETLSSVFTVEDMKIAVSLHHLHPERSNFTADPENIEKLIERSGAACIHAWKSSLDEQIGMRVYLMEQDEEREDEIHSAVSTDLARKIVTAVSIALNNETEETSPIAA